MKTRIKELRQEKSFTQESLALEAGVTQTTLSRIECEVAIPDADLLIRLSGIFQVSIDYILCLSDQRTHAFSISRHPAHPSTLRKLNPDQRVHLQNFIESMQTFY